MAPFFVAVGEIAGSIDDEAAPLAAAAGLTVFDVRTRLAGVLPRILYHSPSEAAARQVLAAVRSRGHGALLCDGSSVPRAGDFVLVKRFAFDADGLLATSGVPRRTERLSFDDIGAIIRVALRATVVRSRREKELRPQGGRPPATVEVERTAHESVVVHAAYVVPGLRDATRPRIWLVHERESSFLVLGAALRKTRRENLTCALDLIRERAPRAVYDDRFVLHPLVSSQIVTVRDNLSPEAPPPDGSADLLVCILADWLLSRTPYR